LLRLTRTGKKGSWPVDMNAVRRILLSVCAVALVALAVFQSTDLPHGEALAVGVATKIITALIAIAVAGLASPPEA
jgi:hypothetical protein